LIKLASENGFYGTVDQLLQNGADPDYSNSLGFTALFYGKFFVFATIKYLIDQFIIFLSKQNGRQLSSLFFNSIWSKCQQKKYRWFQSISIVSRF
jgi:ankyrin repeat protein